METEEIVELMLKSSDHNPYTGMLSEKDNLIAAIGLAKLCKDFADKGQMDEAMNIPSEQWVVVISELEGMSLDAVNDRPLMTKNIGGDKCPKCGAVEVDVMTPRTTYACGSSDYDQRPNTFNQSEQCRVSAS